ncbi:MAG: hypothetical protein LBS50_06195 [Prevotellaceae bacterium]|jgi:hypothetical protein|nr:hypothetical protein [Prevotellaceae bacterium]
MVIAVDFDGTIVEEAYPAIGKPIPFAIEVLKKLQNEEHHQLILWTVREGKLLDDAVNYCRERGVEFYAVNKLYPEDDNVLSPRKIAADIFIDDRSVGGLPDWGLIYRMITKNLTLEKALEVQNELHKDNKGFFKKLFV